MPGEAANAYQMDPSSPSADQLVVCAQDRDVVPHLCPDLPIFRHHCYPRPNQGQEGRPDSAVALERLGEGGHIASLASAIIANFGRETFQRSILLERSEPDVATNYYPLHFGGWRNLAQYSS
jgi:hypothetical protein